MSTTVANGVTEAVVAVTSITRANITTKQVSILWGAEACFTSSTQCSTCTEFHDVAFSSFSSFSHYIIIII
jgi:hypothetical protein